MVSHSQKIIRTKERLVKDLQNEVRDKNVLFIGIGNISTRNLNQIRKELDKQNLRLIVTKKTFFDKIFADTPYFQSLRKSLHGVKLGIVVGATGIFDLFTVVEKQAIPSFLKAGTKLEENVVVPEGDTGFKPGPFLSELTRVGLPSLIKEGAVHIRKTTVFLKNGDIVSKPQADVLQKLNIRPMTDRLLIYGGGQAGLVYQLPVLQSVGQPTILRLHTCFNKSIQTALQLGMITPTTLPLLIAQNYRKFIGLAQKLMINTPETISLRLIDRCQIVKQLHQRLEHGN